MILLSGVMGTLKHACSYRTNVFRQLNLLLKNLLFKVNPFFPQQIYFNKENVNL